MGEDSLTTVIPKQERLSPETPHTDKIVAYFESRSGMHSDEIRSAMGNWLLPQLEQSPKDVIGQHFHQEDPRNRSFISTYENLSERAGEDTAREVFWRDLLVYRWKNDEGFRQYIQRISGDSLKEVLSEDGETVIENILPYYEGAMPDLLGKLRDTDRQRIEADLKPGETLEQRVAKAQSGLVEAHETAKGVYAQGKIPIFRYMFLKQKRIRKILFNNAKTRVNWYRCIPIHL